MELCSINIKTLKEKLYHFKVIRKKIEDNSKIIEFEAGGYNYKIKFDYVIINFDGNGNNWVVNKK